MTEPVPDLPVSSAPSELVADSRYLDLVIRTLTSELRLDVTEIDSIDAFDLTRLRIAEPGPPGRNGAPASTGQPVDVDAVLHELRWRFAADYGGWTVALGKNRDVAAQIGGFPQPQSMLAGGHPVPVDAAELASTADPDGGKGIRVGILDTRIFLHKDIRDRIVPLGEGVEIADDEDMLPERAGHATFIAGLVLARAPAARIHVRHVLDDETGRASVWRTAKQMAEFLADKDRIHILNLSLGFRTADGRPPLVLQRAIERLSRHMVVVAAAGNHGALKGMVRGITRRSQTWPAALPLVIAVGAPAAFSPQLPWVTVVAPGVDVRSTFLKGQVKRPDGEIVCFPDGYALWSGTSFAAATVSGILAANAGPGTGTTRTALQRLRGDQLITFTSAP